MKRALCLALMVACLAVPAGADSLWEWVNPLPQGHSLEDVIAVDGTLVAVGDAGTVTRSRDDGRTWESLSVVEGYDLLEIDYAGGRFVAAGAQFDDFGPVSAVILSSEDAVHWVERFRTEERSIESFAWSGSLFVAVGTGGRSYTSGDGLTWEEHQLPSGLWAMSDVVWTGSAFVSFGTGVDPSAEYYSFISEDGIEWETSPLDEEAQPRAMVFDGERIVAVGIGHSLISEDGRDWSFVESEELSPSDLAYSNGLFVAGGTNGRIATSPDGSSWSVWEVPRPADFPGLANNGSAWIAVGDFGLVLRSPDAVVWEEVGGDVFGLQNASVYDLAWGGGRFVGVGEAGLAITSIDGVNWTHTWVPVLWSLESVHWIDDRFWSVGRGGEIVTSIDGQNWEFVFEDDELSMCDLASSGSVVVVVGWELWHFDDRVPSIATSGDGGDTWIVDSLATEGALYGVEWTGELFVAVGSHGQVATSVDGTDWQWITLETDIVLRQLEWNGRSLVATGYRYPVGEVYVVGRPSGDSWELYDFPEGLGGYEDLTWTGDCFVGVGAPSGDGIMTNADTTSWSLESSETALGLMAIASDGRQLIATGPQGAIVRRTAQPRCTPGPRNPTGRAGPPRDSKIQAPVEAASMR